MLQKRKCLIRLTTNSLVRLTFSTFKIISIKFISAQNILAKYFEHI